jgi:hypothetical protein
VPSVPSFAELIDSAERSAVHLEMRDVYAVADEQEQIAAWRAGRRRAVARGVAVRRARVVSEPVSEYIRYEYSGTFTNVAAGEEVRWLPRRDTVGLCLPANDFWLIDGRRVRWNHFDGAGTDTEPGMSDDPAIAEQCAAAFEAVWDRAIPHEDYKIS